MAYLVLMLHNFLSICLVISIFDKLLFLYNVPRFINDYFRNLPFAVLLLLRLDDVETNPGPKNRQCSNHWNLNGLAVHDFLKVS